MTQQPSAVPAIQASRITLRNFILLTVCVLLNSLMVNGQIALPPPAHPDQPDAGLPYAIWLDPITDDFAEIQRQAEAYFERHGKGRAYKHWKRWEFIHEHRLGPGGKLVNYMEKNLAALRAYEKTHAPNPGRVFGGLWETEATDDVVPQHPGVGHGIGRVNVIAFHPTNTSIIFAGTPAGGIWKTTNEGISWTPLSDGIPSLGVSGIAIHPTNPDIIYILTGDGDGGHTPCIGVLKSTNGGQTWEKPGPFPGDSTDRAYKLAMRPGDPNVLFAATDDGLYKTANGGITWTRVLTASMRDIEFRPGTPDTMYASSTNRVYYSHDGGETWLNADPFQQVQFTANRCALAVTPADPDYVYAVFGPGIDTGAYRGLYVSTNSGASFTVVTNEPNVLDRSVDGMDGDFQGQAWWDLAIAVDPQDRDKVIIGAINIWRNNGWEAGQDWEIVTHWYPPTQQANNLQYTHADIHDLVFQTNSRIWCGSDGGVYLSTNDGITWTDKTSAGTDNGLTSTQFFRICGTPQNPNLLVGAAQDNGCLKWTGGNDMTQFAGGDGTAIAIDPTNSNIFYFYQLVGSLQKSIDGGATYTNIDPSPTPASSDPPFRIDPSNPLELWTGQDTIYRSLDGGNTWSALFPSPGSPKFRYIYCPPSNDQVIYVATSRKIFRNATNGAGTWTEITGNLPIVSGTNNSNSVYITGIVTDNSSSNQVWVTLSGYQDGDKVFYTATGADPWTNVSGSLPNVPVNCIAYDDNETNDDAIYIGTDIGVFYKDAALSDWVPYQNGLPNVIVNDLYVNATADRIYAGTFGRGLWSSQLYDECAPFAILTTGNSGDTSPEGYKFFQVSDQISSTAEVTGGIGTQVFYKAGNSISLNEGFRAHHVEAFRAWLGPCTGGVPIIPFTEGEPAGSTSSRASENEVAATEVEAPEPEIQETADAGTGNIHVILRDDNSSIDLSTGQAETGVSLILLKNGSMVRVLSEDLLLAPGIHTIPLSLDAIPRGEYQLLVRRGHQRIEVPVVIE